MAGFSAINRGWGRVTAPSGMGALSSPSISTAYGGAQATPQNKLYSSAVEQQAGDYSNIMQGYKDLLTKTNTMPQMTAQTYTPQQYDYSPSADFTNAIKNLTSLSQTGGYSPSDIANIRERGISPIRSVYAGAQRDVDRQRALQGGFSPNYAATRTKMAREMSDLISGKTTDINAQIAENVARNKMSIAPALASTTGGESALRNQYGMANANLVNEANKFNLDMPYKAGNFNMGLSDQAMKALQGMQSLYGTTPALSSLFGNQAMQSAQMQNQGTEQQGRRGLDFISRVMSGMRR